MPLPLAGAAGAIKAFIARKGIQEAIKKYGRSAVTKARKGKSKQMEMDLRPPSKTTTSRTTSKSKSPKEQMSLDLKGGGKTASTKPSNRRGRGAAVAAGAGGGLAAALLTSKSGKSSSKPTTTTKKDYSKGVSKGGVSFKESFKYNRGQGKKTFTWNFKKYTT